MLYSNFALEPIGFTLLKLFLAAILKSNVHFYWVLADTAEAVISSTFAAIMEVHLYDSTYCRLCAEENPSGVLLYSDDDSEGDLSALVNRYLPFKVNIQYEYLYEKAT
jgi:hypothetical protein